MPEYLKTGLAALDTLLGGQGVIQGSAILIRGEPGTGKTTLALQMAKHALQQEAHAFVYLSVEEPPEVSLNRITQSFWDKDVPGFLGHPERYSLEDLTRHWDYDIPKDLLEEYVEDLLDETIRLTPLDSPLPSFDDIRARIRRDLKKIPQDRLNNDIQDRMKGKDLGILLRRFWQRITGPRGEVNGHARDQSGRGVGSPLSGWQGPILVVVDSLNALVSGAQMRFREYSERQMVLTALRSFRTWRKRECRENVTVIFIAEELGGRPNRPAESYIADIVIRLAREQVKQPTPLSPDTPPIDWIHDLLFCRVLKGRGLPIQRRSSCYEFVRSDKPEAGGITFYPTYAAQAFVSLFHENQPQLDVINNLRGIDVPFSYPGVVVQQFTRSGLQRVFAVQRHRTRIPPRHPLMLSNVDEYWVALLQRNGLLHAIPRGELSLFGLPLAKLGTETDASDCTRIIKELESKREFFYQADGDRYVAVPQMANVGILVYRKDLVAEPPETWEDLEEICKSLKDHSQPCSLLLETQTYDTQMTTALELGWAHGAFWRTVPSGPGLKIEFNQGSSFGDFVTALERLQRLIHRDHIVPLRSTVDPESSPPGDWVFARHWYSTWVDVLTRTDPQGQPLVKFEKEARFGIAKLPISRSYRERLLASGQPVVHHSGWGEWYLAIQKGSENIELGIELINNLMTARKISESALSGAALPVVEKFYELYGDDICFGTDLTFNQMREMFFGNAQSRMFFEDYQRMSRVLSGALHAIVTNPRADVRKLLVIAFKELDHGFKPS